jgi:hypothetical protein
VDGIRVVVLVSDREVLAAIEEEIAPPAHEGMGDIARWAALAAGFPDSVRDLDRNGVSDEAQNRFTVTAGTFS